MISRENAYFKNPEMKGLFLSSYFTSPYMLPCSPQFLDLDRCLGDIHTMITGKIPLLTPPPLLLPTTLTADETPTQISPKGKRGKASRPVGSGHKKSMASHIGSNLTAINSV